MCMCVRVCVGGGGGKFFFHGKFASLLIWFQKKKKKILAFRYTNRDQYSLERESIPSLKMKGFLSSILVGVTLRCMSVLDKTGTAVCWCRNACTHAAFFCSLHHCWSLGLVSQFRRVDSLESFAWEVILADGWERWQPLSTVMTSTKQVSFL